jgi:hypothetical protein
VIVSVDPAQASNKDGLEQCRHTSADLPTVIMRTLLPFAKPRIVGPWRGDPTSVIGSLWQPSTS